MRHTTQIHSDAILATTPDHLLLTSLRAVLSTPQGSNPKATPATYILPVSELARFRTARSDHSTPPKRRLDFAVTDGTPSSPHSISLITSSPSSPSKARSAPTKPAPASGKSPESSRPGPRKDSSSWRALDQDLEHDGQDELHRPPRQECSRKIKSGKGPPRLATAHASPQTSFRRQSAPPTLLRQKLRQRVCGSRE